MTISQTIAKAQVEALVHYDIAVMTKDYVKKSIKDFRYERKIKKSQKRIGQYVPPTCKTIYA